MQGYWVRFKADGSHDVYSGAHFAGAEWVEGIDAATLDSCCRVNGEWLPRPPAPAPAPEPLPHDPEAAEDARKIAGVEFEGVMCSATREDQNGLAAVILAIQMQGTEFQPTLFHFSNGSRLVITQQNYRALAATWLPFRQSFFRA